MISSTVCVDHFAKEHSPVQWLSCRFETQKDFCKTCAHVTLHALNCNKFIRRSCKIIQLGMHSFSSHVRGTPGCNSNLEHFDLQCIILYTVIYIYSQTYIIQNMYHKRYVHYVCIAWYCIIPITWATSKVLMVAEKPSIAATLTEALTKTSTLAKYVRHLAWFEDLLNTADTSAEVQDFWCRINVQEWTSVWI